MEHRMDATTLATARLALVLTLGVGVAGCAIQNPLADSAEPLGAGDFRATDSPPIAVAPPRPLAPPPPPPLADPTPPAQPGVESDPIATVGEPDLPTGTARPIGDETVIDAMVGQINGVPVFANEILGELDGVLRDLARRSTSQREWAAAAGREIVIELRQRTEDDLLLDEARSRIPRETQAIGFRNFLETIRRDLAIGEGGSAAAAERRLLEDQGVTLAQKAQQTLDERLINQELYQQAFSRVSVSGRDVEIRYEREFDRFNPVGVAKLYVVGARADDPDAAQRVTDSLASGTPFSELAASDANTAGLKSAIEPRLTGQVADSKLLDIAELDGPARTLEVGEHTGPIEYSGRLFWVHLASVDRPEGQSLYEAQAELERQIELERREAARRKYISRLLQRGSYDDFDKMMISILEIATARYYVPAQEAAASGGSQ